MQPNPTGLQGKSDSLGIPSFFAGSPGWEALLEPSQQKHVNLHNSERTPLVYFSPVCGPPAQWVCDLIWPWLCPSTALLRLLLFLGHGVSFSGRFQHPPVNDSSIASCDFGALTGDECTSFYYVILNQSLFVVLIGISLMVSDVQPLFLYLLATCTYLENCLFKSFAHFKSLGFFFPLYPFFPLMCFFCREKKNNSYSMLETVSLTCFSLLLFL